MLVTLTEWEKVLPSKKVITMKLSTVPTYALVCS